MDRLWAPWRMHYIQSADDQEGCIFCRFPTEEDDANNLLVLRGRTAFVLLNAYPYSNGHLMVTPYRHTAEISDLNADEMAELMALTGDSIGLLRQVFRPDGFNVGMNLGRVAGAGIADHLHIHVVPRWSGDTNFMPVIGDVRVIPESLAVVHAQLTERLNA